MKLLVSEDAERDLDSIGTSIGVGRSRQAEAFFDQLYARILLIADNPEAYPILPRYRRAGIRRRSFRNDLIFYTVATDRVVIVRVLHGARDFGQLLSSAMDDL